MRPILILGASGFVGYTIYKELARYFNTYGTYNSSKDYVKINYIFHIITKRQFRTNFE